ncbi:Htur_1727 family rSAM-partnered candidate RiPP [Natrarchaeobius chitinivorans]|uniref:RSAM-partnered protein n=1 Tax=Natrarchaeobius chitinivorans TaxID=1679083 RepID=A0A3N6LQ83_NATCH|nr:Htur_1727 family rSAM-partnered candidate RiPP [Natrarchaeobius chitinivorans]RQG90407.1 rSAM-partnered protein [Natrarchaeobius chitinivorans]
MGDNSRRSKVECDERGNPRSQWEVFVRQRESEPMCHVGSVAADSEPAAYEHASHLFDRYAVDVWICPAAEVGRYSARTLSAGGDESRVSEP